jgi:hypothetical protein
MAEVIIIGEKDQAKPASDRDFGTRGERRKVETEELARCPVPGNGPSRRVLWDGRTDPDEQAQNEASRLARLRGLT